MATTVAIDRRVIGEGVHLRHLWLLVLACFFTVGASCRASASINGGQGTATPTTSVVGGAPPAYGASSMTGTPPIGSALAGCSMQLPSGRDQRVGLAQQYLNDQQGRSVLIAPMVGAREIFSDNVTLAPHGRESPDFVTALMPGLTVCSQTPHITGHFHYQMDALYYAEHQNRNSIFNEFDGVGHAVILGNHLFFDASTDYGLAVINPSQSYSLDPVLDVGNRTNAWTFLLSPYWVQSLGPLGISITRYSYERALYNDPNIPAFYSNTGSFELTNPPDNGNWSWVAAYQTSQLVRQGPYLKNYMDTASLQLGYKVSSHLQLLGQGGVEDKYLPNGTIRRLKSPFWNGGIRWSDRLTSLELRFGHRFFGKSFYGLLTHQGKHLTVSISYIESPEVSGLNNMGTGLYGLPTVGSISGAPIGSTPLPGQSLLPLSSLLDNRIYLSKSLVGSATYHTGRSEINIEGYRIRNRYLQSSLAFTTTQQDITGAEAYWRWQWHPRLFVIPRFTFSKYRFAAGSVSYITTEYLSFALMLSPTAQAGFTLEHLQRVASVPTSSYRENAVILQVIKIF